MYKFERGNATVKVFQVSEGTKYCKSSKILRGKGKKFGKGRGWKYMYLSVSQIALHSL